MKCSKIILIVASLNLFLFASEDIPTKEEVVKLYVATFKRAPDSAGLDYWTNQSGLKLSKIAESFFDQSETKTLYPDNTSNRDFIESVYSNLFNRLPDDAGLDYWVEQLESGTFSKNRFIEAVINGAQGNDSTILSNKSEVAIEFASKGLNDIDEAKSIMSNITYDPLTVTSALTHIESLTPNDTINTTNQLDGFGQGRPTNKVVVIHKNYTAEYLNNIKKATYGTVENWYQGSDSSTCQDFGYSQLIYTISSSKVYRNTSTLDNCTEFNGKGSEYSGEYTAIVTD